MSGRPFRFIHSSDFHLELPLFGIAEVPDHLRELFLEAPYQAVRNIFDATLAEEADFLLLSGDIINPAGAGPRGILFLLEQFERLAEKDIPVFWSGGRVDPAGAWPAAAPPPEGVHVFPRGQVQERIHEREGEPLVRIIGSGRGRGKKIRPADFRPSGGDLFSIALVHGAAQPEALARQGVDYWALGGQHERRTLFSQQQIAHYSGSPQGRQPAEPGPHGATIVRVDSDGAAQPGSLATDLLRWFNQRLVTDEQTDRGRLEGMLCDETRALVHANPGVNLIINWTIGGGGSAPGWLRDGRLTRELIDMLRTEFGHGPPAIWTASIETEPPQSLSDDWYDEDTIRGEFLRQLRQLQQDDAEPVDLEEFLDERHIAGTVASAVSLSDPAIRERALRRVAVLGADLLSTDESVGSGEEVSS